MIKKYAAIYIYISLYGYHILYLYIIYVKFIKNGADAILSPAPFYV